MGGTQQSKMTEVSQVEHLSYLEEGDFAKLYKGYIATTGGGKQAVTIKVPKVPDYIRKEKSKLGHLKNQKYFQLIRNELD